MSQRRDITHGSKDRIARWIGRVLRPHPFLWLLMAVTLLKGALWSAAIPYLQAPDEPSHFSLVQFVAESGRLPEAGEGYISDEIATSMRLAGTWDVAFHPKRQPIFAEGAVGPNEQAIVDIDPALRRAFELERPSTANFVPPLYHATATLGYLLFYHHDILARLFAARMVSVLLSVLLAGVAYMLAREVFPHNPAMWITIPIVVSFQPMVTFLGAVVNSDILLFLLFGLATWLIVRALRLGLTWQRAAALGMALGLGLLVKPTILTCGLGLAVVLAVELVRRPGERIKLLAMAALVVGVMLAISGWYMLRSYLVQGSFVYSNPLNFPRVQNILDPQPDLTLGEYWSTYAPLLESFSFDSYWGYFGWVDTPMPETVFLSLRWICGLSIAGLVLGAVAAARRRPVAWSRFLLFSILVLLSVSSLPVVFGRAYWVARQTGILDSSIQGRYHLGAWLAQAALLVYGLTRLAPRRLRSLAHLAVRAGVIALNAYALVAVILPRYYL